MKKTFRVVSFLEGLSYILLLFIATPIKYFGGDDSFVKMLGMPHGLLFIAYIFLAWKIKEEQNWDRNTYYKVLVASVIPFGTFYVDRQYLRA